jgi:BioD-like phosphotransacetylase family protein
MAASIFVAGIGQHTGKTVVSLGLMAGLTRRGYRVHYMKPVGQQFVQMGSDMVDKDVALINTVYDLSTPPKAASPISIPSGYTRQFILGGDDSGPLLQQIHDSYDIIARDADIVVIEGTGHAGVGSVIGLSNARVAHELGSQVILITGPGIGQPIDQFTVNRALLDVEGVKILGVVTNKLWEDRMDEVAYPLRIWLGREGIPLLGALPLRPVLAEMTLRHIVDGIDADVISGHRHLDDTIHECIVGAAPARRLIETVEPGMLIIMPGDRDDLVLAAVSSYSGLGCEPQPGPAVCLTTGLLPNEAILRLVRAAEMPTITSEIGTYELTSRISDLVAKIGPEDDEKLRVAEQLVADYVDLDAIVEAVIH